MVENTSRWQIKHTNVILLICLFIQSTISSAQTDSMAYDIAVSKNTVEEYQYFIYTYPQSSLLPDALTNLNQLHGKWVKNKDYPYDNNTTEFSILINANGQLLVNMKFAQRSSVDSLFFYHLTVDYPLIQEFEARPKVSAKAFTQTTAIIQYMDGSFDEAQRVTRILIETLKKVRTLIADQIYMKSFANLSKLEQDEIDMYLSKKVLVLHTGF